jgi:carbonic anhydrase/acetyltransferase-like protein (isoleucine patch superfamily)
VTDRPGLAAAPIIRAYEGRMPRIDPSAWVAPGAAVVGDVELGVDSSVWYGCVLRGDVERIRLGHSSNIQDLGMVHVTSGRFPALIGDRVTVGHRAVVHGCRVGDEALIGIGAVVLDGAEIGEGALVAAGAVVTPGSVIAPRSLAMGIPARVVRELSDAERKEQVERTLRYVETARKHREADSE